ncbi:MAG: ABC transporter permease [Tissierellia bacterium]|nr:ABC transporter permease [Tissierellia bacterium]
MINSGMAIKPRPLYAVLTKQLKDTFKNKAVFIQFMLFPIMAILLTETIAKSSPDIEPRYFSTMFATMYAGFVPMMVMSSIIGEEKEQYTLKALIMSNVKPWQYLLGVGSYCVVLCMAGASVFGVLNGYNSAEFMRFMVIMFIAIVTTSLLGVAVGMLTKNQMSATAVGLPIAMVSAFLPMIATFNTNVEKFARYFYTQQVNYLINDLSIENFTAERFIIIGVNIVVLIAIFVVSYKKGNLSND